MHRLSLVILAISAATAAGRMRPYLSVNVTVLRPSTGPTLERLQHLARLGPQWNLSDLPALGRPIV